MIIIANNKVFQRQLLELAAVERKRYKTRSEYLNLCQGFCPRYYQILFYYFKINGGNRGYLMK